jgi:7-cyano-7-deazaguanine synthase
VSARDVVILASGGVESAALLARALERGDRVHPLFVRCGFWWEDVELHWLKRQLRALPDVLPLAVADARAFAGVSKGHWAVGDRRPPGARAAYDSVYLPGRNLTLLACAAALCASRKIHRAAIGSMKGNPFRDAKPSFFKTMEKAALDSFGVRLRVEAPLRGMTKRQVVARWPDARWDLTFSCLRPKGFVHCGRCSKCAERRGAVS